MSDNNISNMFDSCVSLNNVNLSSLKRVNFPDPTNFSMNLNDVTKTILAADIKTAWMILFNTYCSKFPTQEQEWKLLLKINNENYEQTVDEIRMWIAENDVKS